MPEDGQNNRQSVQDRKEASTVVRLCLAESRHVQAERRRDRHRRRERPRRPREKPQQERALRDEWSLSDAAARSCTKDHELRSRGVRAPHEREHALERHARADRDGAAEHSRRHRGSEVASTQPEAPAQSGAGQNIDSCHDGKPPRQTALETQGQLSEEKDNENPSSELQREAAGSGPAQSRQGTPRASSFAESAWRTEGPPQRAHVEPEASASPEQRRGRCGSGADGEPEASASSELQREAAGSCPAESSQGARSEAPSEPEAPRSQERASSYAPPQRANGEPPSSQERASSYAPP